MRVAIVHDYLTQRGGAERVVLSLAKAFPGAPLYTSLFEPASTFSEFADLDVHTLALNRIAPLRRHHRAALPLLAPAFSRLDIDADVVVCSSSGWAHGVRTRGRKLVYCHNPARWLQQPDLYLAERRSLARLGLTMLRAPLLRWDRRAALSADRYVVNSTAVKNRVREAYGIEARILPPPVRLTPDGTFDAIAGLESGFLLCVARLLPYKNVDAALQAFREMPEKRLVIAGSGPEEYRLRASAPTNVRFVGAPSDAEMRWLYSACAGLVAPSHEDFGLTVLEAASFGKPVVALRFGGFLDTVREGETGVLIDVPTAAAVARGIRRLASVEWDPELLTEHASGFSEDRFVEEIRAEVEQLAA